MRRIDSASLSGEVPALNAASCSRWRASSVVMSWRAAKRPVAASTSALRRSRVGASCAARRVEKDKSALVTAIGAQPPKTVASASCLPANASAVPPYRFTVPITSPASMMGNVSVLRTPAAALAWARANQRGSLNRSCASVASPCSASRASTHGPLSRYCTPSSAAISSLVATSVKVTPCSRKATLTPTSAGATSWARAAVRFS